MTVSGAYTTAHSSGGRIAHVVVRVLHVRRRGKRLGPPGTASCRRGRRRRSCVRLRWWEEPLVDLELDDAKVLAARADADRGESRTSIKRARLVTMAAHGRGVVRAE